MSSETQEVLALIGAMQTLVENFPMSVLSLLNVKKYNSAMEFIIDILGALGVTDRDIIEFLLTEIIVPNIDLSKLESIDDMTTPDSKFVKGLENATKSFIALMLSELMSCTIHPKVPARYIMKDGIGGVDVPVNAMDPTNILNTCPTSQAGKYMYAGVTSASTPNDLFESNDLNCVIWYSLYKGDAEWVSPTSKQKICDLRSFNTYSKVRFCIDESYEGKSMYRFNKDYLNSIKLFSQKVLLMGLYDKLINGFPTVSINYTINQIFSAAVIGNIIRTTVENDDTEINDCYYSFSNEDWDKMLEDHDLQKYNGKKLNGETAGAVEIDKEKVLEMLDSASSAATLFDKKTIVANSFDEISATPTQDASLLIADGLGLGYDSNWLVNLLTSFIEPVVKSVLSPKVMALIVINFDAAGLISIESLLTGGIAGILEFIKQKILGLLVQLIRLLKDIIIEVVMKFLREKIMPLIMRWKALRIMEKIQYYMNLLKEALECLKLFSFNTPTVITQIDNVNYADIVPEKITPEQSIC